MVTGLFGPQTDLDRIPNWGRNLTTNGEDPYLSGEMVAAQIHGFQGVGAMSEMKHYAVYNGQNQNANTDVQDQALHEMWLTPYEYGFVDALAAAAMCSYQIFRDTSRVSAGHGVVPHSAGARSAQGASLQPGRSTNRTSRVSSRCSELHPPQPVGFEGLHRHRLRGRQERLRDPPGPRSGDAEPDLVRHQDHRPEPA